ncbi:MAG: electron transport complex subunit RsxC [Oscillospiraceae bacterium]|nr:electron transport complex subunit RsxC [Oscillospiraceae bacterium]
MKPVGHIRGGTKLSHYKNTAEQASAVMPAPARVEIAMQQHIGAPCVPCVQKGDTVYVGTIIGDSEKFVSAPIHSSVSGTVAKIGNITPSSGQNCQTVIIESDGQMTLDPSIKPVKIDTSDDLAKAARSSGLVGLGGAGFPTHVKLNINPDKKLDTLIINGAECEPYITSDYREFMENPDDILEGVLLLKRIIGFKNVIICIENNKPEAIDTLSHVIADKNDPSIKIMKLKSHYPQGAEKVLIFTATGRKLPLGKLPADVGCVVMNVTSIAFLSRYIRTGMPLVSKRITIDGGAVTNPQNVIVPIGTPIKDVIDFCGGLKCEPKKILMGGPMMGVAVLDINAPILKQNNAILVFDEREATPPPITPCIRCGRCAAACPMNLIPAAVETALKLKNVDHMKNLNVAYCIECGSCAFSCPAKRPLTQTMRLAKMEVRKS